MGVKVANNAVTATAGAISSTATAVTVTAGTGALFPILGGGDYFYATLFSTAGVREIVKVTARTDDAMTIVRSQEGTLAQAFPANSRFELRITAASITDMFFDHDQASEITFAPTGGISATNVQAAIAELDSEAAKSAALAASGGAVLVGYIAPGTGAVADTVKGVLDDDVRANSYGTLQQAATYAASLTDGIASIRAQVNLGAANYTVASTLTHYEGQTWQGMGNAEALDRLASRITVSTDNIDGIQMQGHLVGSVQYWNYGQWDNWMIIGKGSTSTSGWAMNWFDGTNDLRPQGQTTVRRVTLRNFASGGGRMNQGALETRIADVKVMDTGGPGWYFKGVTNGVQSMVFDGLAADHCVDSALYLDTPVLDGHTSIRDLKSEAGINYQYGPKITFTASCAGTALTTTGSPALAVGHVVFAANGTSLGPVTSGAGNAWVVATGGAYTSQTMSGYTAISQSNALVINTPVTGATIVLDGATHISSGSNNTMPGSIIKLVNGGNTPMIRWQNAYVRKLTAQTNYPPTTFTGGCVATLTGDAVTSISAPTAIGGYDPDPLKPPIIRLVGGGGTGATATGVVTDGRLVITVGAGGSGYTTAPTVYIDKQPSLLDDDTYGITIQSKFKSANYGNDMRGDFSRGSGVYWCLGAAYDYLSTSVEAPGWQLAGSTPGISLYATGAAADTRKILLVNSGGAFTIRTVTDAGVSTIALNVNNSAGVPSSIEVGADFRPNTNNARTLGTISLRWSYVHTYYARTHALTVGTLATAATAGAGARAFVTDSNVAAAGNFGSVVAAGGSNNVPVYSDGTDWRIG
jgi:hypothetical protein